MKKLSLIIAFIIALGNLTYAQKSKKGDSGIEPPAAVLKTFNSKYKQAKKTVWSEEEENFRADFKYGDANVVMAVTYSADGKLIYIEKQMPKTQYNKTAIKYITDEYPGYKINSMRKRDTYDKKTTYITMLRKGKEVLEVEFDKKGGFIKDTDKTPATVGKKKGKKSEEDEETTDEEDKPAKKDTKAKKKTDDDDEEATPPPAKKETKATPPKKSKDDDDEEATPPPAKKETKATPPPKKSKDDDDEEEATPPPAKKETKATPPPKKSKDDDDEEDAKPTPKKEKAKPAPKKEKKKSGDDDDDE